MYSTGRSLIVACIAVLPKRNQKCDEHSGFTSNSVCTQVVPSPLKYFAMVLHLGPQSLTPTTMDPTAKALLSQRFAKVSSSMIRQRKQCVINDHYSAGGSCPQRARAHGESPISSECACNHGSQRRPRGAHIFMQKHDGLAVKLLGSSVLTTHSLHCTHAQLNPSVRASIVISTPSHFCLHIFLPLLRPWLSSSPTLWFDLIICLLSLLRSSAYCSPLVKSRSCLGCGA